MGIKKMNNYRRTIAYVGRERSCYRAWSVRSLLLLFLFSPILITSCSDDDAPDIKFIGSSSVELQSVVNQSSQITFHADGAWKLTGTAKWLTFSPRQGSSGDHTITLTTTETNRTKNSRTTQLTVTCGSVQKKISVRQRGDYAVFSKKEYKLPSEGGIVNIMFTTNLTEDKLELYNSNGLDQWIKASGSSSRATTREDYEGHLRPLTVLPNTGRNAREGAFFLMMKNPDGELMGLDTLWIRQDGLSSGYTSTDFSQDGQVYELQQHTTGKGISIVIMGDGFVDKEISDGTYDKVMRRAVDNLFSEEPIRSMKDYFDISIVVTVSRNDQFGNGYSTALSCLPDLQTTGIDVDEEAVGKYLNKVKGIDMEQTLAVVILNNNQHKGVTYLYTSPDGTRPINYSVALCPIIDNLESEVFRQVLVHEAVGHGFAKLADEYVNSASGSATDQDKAQIRWLHGYDWLMNVDVEADSARILWSRFISDSRYQTEQIGVVEGGDTFFKGVYRPTQRSMMNENDCPFNAPSRQAIYRKIIYMATGKEPSYEDFVAFDEAHKPTIWDYSSKTRSPWSDWQRVSRKSCIVIRNSY